MELALKGESQRLFAGLVDHMRRDVKTVDDTDVVDEQSLWSEEEAEIIRNSQWGATTQTDMVLHKIWGSYAKVDMVLVDAMLPVSVANRDSDIVSLLLKRGADVHRPVRFRGARRLDPSETITPLLMAILQDSRELVALMLESGRKARDGPKLLAAIETTAGRGGMRRTELTRMLIAHGALEGEAAEQQIESTGSGSEDKFSIRDAGEKSQDLAWWENALVGEWEGEYTYTHSWHGGVRYPTSFQVGGVASKKLLSVLDKDATLFDGGGSDTVDRFAIHGQVLSGNTVRFVKLYPPDSWMYEGSVDQAEGRWRMRGTWGLRFGRAHARGRFTLMKKKD
ncbi:hypothetical protein N656DRAFT_784024 [Canariomyces notabilis]|uniref:Ankyrin repeat protein n=1 Tax=Canariomyces notabilis TaxID=2074819 RepID=A0AAN6T8T7_9PEZI|nr:hypothetical protein N656DRAFT_784024 [Canariomyces arenarius]